MPYQKIGTPVFWVDTLQYLRTMGVGGPAYRPSDHVIPQNTNTPYFDWRKREDQSDIFNLNPTSYPSSAEIQYRDDNSAWRNYEWSSIGASPQTLTNDDINAMDEVSLPNIYLGNIDYVALLNHNLCSSDYNTILLKHYKWIQEDNQWVSENEDFTFTSYVNGDTGGAIGSADGFSIFETSLTDMYAYQLILNIIRNQDGSSGELGDITNFGSPQIGCCSIGKRYQMPQSPDLNLTQTYDYGVKEVETKGGASLSNNMWKNPKWGQLGAWELASVANNVVDQNAVNLSPLARSGRKVYDLSFSYLDDGDVFGANQTLSLGDSAWQGIVTQSDYPDIDDDGIRDVNDDDEFNKNILNDSSFFTSVIHKTNGGQLPFIFQPNSEDKTNMVIAKLDMKSFSFKQVANGVYNIKLKIREVW